MMLLRRVLGAGALMGSGWVWFLSSDLSHEWAWLPILYFGLGALVLIGRFWSRWLAMGVAAGGVALARWVVAPSGVEPEAHFVALSALGLLTMLSLNGDDMARSFHGEGAWRFKNQLANETVDRVQFGFFWIGAAAPALFYAVERLAPISRKPELAHAALLLAMVGAVGLLKLQSWALSTLGTAALLLLLFARTLEMSEIMASPAPAVVALLAAIMPFAKPMIEALRDAD